VNPKRSFLASFLNVVYLNHLSNSYWLLFRCIRIWSRSWGCGVD